MRPSRLAATLLLAVALPAATAEAHTLGSVQADDIAFRSSQKPSEAGAEAKALRGLLEAEGEDHDTAKNACTEAYVSSADRNREGSLLPPLEQDKRWQLMTSVWRERQWEDAASPAPAPPPGTNPDDGEQAVASSEPSENAAIATLEHVIQQLVSHFDAPHLRPTMILDQMKNGNALACHSLLTLTKHLRNHKKLLDKDEL
jgi:hypothetical protein